MHNLALAALEQGQFGVASEWVSRGLRLSRHDDDLRRLRMQVWIAQIRRAFRLVFRLES
jgi:hypothetical protein